MNRFNAAAVVASIVINASVLSVIATGIDRTQTPRGEVSITEVADPSSPQIVALAGVERPAS